MKFRANTRDFADAVGAAAKIIKNNTTVPMLLNVLIRAEDGNISVRATDLETTIEKTLSAEIDGGGEIAVGGKLLAQWLTNVKNDVIEVSMEGNDLVLNAGKAAVAFPTQDGGQFPVLPTHEDSGPTIRIDAKALRGAVISTSFAASQEEARGAVLMGTHIKAGGDGTVLVCTDGYRLAIQKNVSVQEVESTCVIPTNALLEAARNIGDADAVEATVIGAGRNQMRLIAGRTTIYVRLVDGNYPDYEKVLPKNSDRKVTVNTVELQDALKRSVIVAGDRASMIILEVDAAGITLNATSDTSGRAREQIEAEVQGEDLKINLNARYFIEILSHVNAPSTILEFAGPLAPVIIRPAEDLSETEQKYILMPLRQ